MRIPTLLLAALATLSAGCAAPVANEAAALEADAATEETTPFELVWKGNVLLGALDGAAHDRPTEDVIFPYQQAGFSVQIDEVPQAIEVRVDWQGPGEFMLHPHWVAGEANGTKEYIGYPSEYSNTGSQCIRIPDEDMAAGVWPMMIHPGSDSRNIPFTITVGILGATGTVLEEFHGHPYERDWTLKNREPLPCAFLAQ